MIPPVHKRPLVEILYFDGCPNHEAARRLVEKIGDDAGIEIELRLVAVEDEKMAQQERFLGSPTIRVEGRDVDPDASRQNVYALSCRVYRTENRFASHPDPGLVRDAIEHAAAAAPSEEA